MKYSLLIIFLLSVAIANAQDNADGGWTNMLDASRSQWETYLSFHHQAGYTGKQPMNATGDSIRPIGYNKDDSAVFSVIKEGDDLVMKVTGEYYGCTFTKLSYRNFRLKLKVKWGTKVWEARAGKLKDAGVLYFSQGPAGMDYWRAWMLSQEFNFMEGHFGDYWNIANAAIDIRAFMSEGSMSAAAGNQQPFMPFGVGTKNTGFCMRTADYSTPGNGWTEIELVCFEGKSLHIVNGRVVMVLANSRYHLDGVDHPLVEGKIQLQSEGNEVYYKDIKIKNIHQMPEEFKAYYN